MKNNRLTNKEIEIIRDSLREMTVLDRPMLQLKLGDKNDFHVNDYLRLVRLKYWRGLFTNEKFMHKLTIKLRDQYLETVDKMKDYDFSIYNIKQIIAEMNAQVITGVKDEILKMFDKLTSEHTWFPECKQNKHYYSGWRTNGHKIGKKSIIPEYLQRYSYSSSAFDVGKAYGVLSDIEKIFDYLSGRTAQNKNCRRVPLFPLSRALFRGLPRCN